jgi:hypothetical protein
MTESKKGFTPLESPGVYAGDAKNIKPQFHIEGGVKAPSFLTGFTYTVSREQIDEYTKWPLDRRLKWLFYANKMRRLLPQRTIEIQEAFRQGKI